MLIVVRLRVSNKLILPVGAAAVVITILVIVLASGLSSDLASGSEIITASTPGVISAVEVTDVKVVDKYSVPPLDSLQFSAFKDPANPFGIIFEVANIGTEELDLDQIVDEWVLWLQDPQSKERTTEPKDVTADIHIEEIADGGAATLLRVNLQDHERFFEDRPAKYQLVLMGQKSISWNLTIAEDNLTVPANSVLVEPSPDGGPPILKSVPIIAVGGAVTEEVTRYSATVEFDAGYDTAALRSNPNKLIRADKMEIGFTGNGSDFLIAENKGSELLLSIVNTGKEPISAVPSTARVLLFNVANIEDFAGTGAILEPNPDACVVLQPGERQIIDRIKLEKGVYPLQNLMNRLAGQDEFEGKSFVEGLYILKVQYMTIGCENAEGQHFPGALFEVVAAFDVTSGVIPS